MTASAISPQNVLEQLSKEPIPSDCQWEMTVSHGRSRTVSWADGKPSLMEDAISEGVCARVLEDGRQGLVTSRDVTPGFANRLIAQARVLAKVSPRDPFRRFAEKMDGTERLAAGKHAWSHSPGVIIAACQAAEKAALEADKRVKKVVQLRHTDETKVVTLVNSLGFAGQKTLSAIGVSSEILAEANGDSEVAWDSFSSRLPGDVNLPCLAAAAAAHAATSLGGTPILSGRYPLVLPPRVGAQLLSLLSAALSADAAQSGQSFLEKNLGQKVAASHITLRDDPFVSRGVSSEPFDDEGIPHSPLMVIKNGILETFLYDLRSAAKAKRLSTGHGMKQNLSSLPRPDATNLVVDPGDGTPEELLASHPQVVLVHDVMGLHMADTATGEFSLGASGFIYKNGKQARPVKGITISGTLRSLLDGVEAVGSDLTWNGSFGTPSLLIGGLSIGGS